MWPTWRQRVEAWAGRRGSSRLLWQPVVERGLVASALRARAPHRASRAGLAAVHVAGSLLARPGTDEVEPALVGSGGSGGRAARLFRWGAVEWRLAASVAAGSDAASSLRQSRGTVDLRLAFSARRAHWPERSWEWLPGATSLGFGMAEALSRPCSSGFKVRICYPSRSSSSRFSSAVFGVLGFGIRWHLVWLGRVGVMVGRRADVAWPAAVGVRRAASAGAMACLPLGAWVP